MTEPSGILGRSWDRAVQAIVTEVDRLMAAERQICAHCHEPATTFRDVGSRAAYDWWGLCQGCQDALTLRQGDRSGQVGS
jgi:hypothetical protein